MGFPRKELTLQSGKYKTADEYIKADERSCHQREATARRTDVRAEGERMSFVLCAAILKVGVAGGFIKSSRPGSGGSDLIFSLSRGAE